MIDLEHCFFSRALNVEGIDDPFDPAAIDALSVREEIEERTRRMVLTPRTMTRSRRSYFRVHETPRELVKTFQTRLPRLLRVAQSETVELALGFLSSRLARQAPSGDRHTRLPTGDGHGSTSRTSARRIDQDPLEVLDSFCALES